MKKLHIGGIVAMFIIILIIGGFVFLKVKPHTQEVESNKNTEISVTHNSEGQSNNPDSTPPALSQPELCVSVQGEEYFAQISVKATIGNIISNGSNVELSNFGFTKPEEGKRVILTFSNSGCAGCQKFHPMFKEWVEKYNDKVEIFAVLYGPPHTNERIKEDLSSAGLKTAAFPDLQGLIAEEYQKYETLLINEKGKVVYGLYTFDISKWKIVDQLVSTFIERGIIKDQKIESIEKDKTLNIKTLVDINGKEYNLKKVKDKSTIFFINWPQFKLNSLVYPIVQDTYNKFKDESNVYLILYDLEKKTGELVEEYYERYNLDIDYIKKENLDMKEILKDINLQNVPIFVDENWEYFDYSAFDVTPNIIICDEDLKVIDILNLGRCLRFGSTDGNITVDDVLSQILK